MNGYTFASVEGERDDVAERCESSTSAFDSLAVEQLKLALEASKAMERVLRARLAVAKEQLAAERSAAE